MKNKKVIIIVGVILIILVSIIILINSKKVNEVVLKTKGGVSYLWEYNIENNNIIELEEKESEEKTKNVVGGEKEQHFIFKGLKEGTTTITFDHRNIVENNVTNTKKYKVTVDKKLEVNLKEIK